MNLDALNLNALRPLIPVPLLIKGAILAGVVVLMLAGYYFVLWSPLQDDIASEKLQVESQRVQLQKNNRLASNIPKKRKEYEKLQVQLKIALNMLPKKSQLPDLLEGVTWAGKDSGLAFSSFKPGREVVKSIYAEVPVSFEVGGTFKQLLTFLKRVGEMSRIVDIKDLNMKAKDSELTVSGQVVTYRFVEAKTKKKNKRKR